MSRIDDKFSQLVRTLARWKCVKCRWDYRNAKHLLHCSHFHSRRHTATRFDLQNCDALCWKCHDFFGTHRRKFESWKLKQLGPGPYNAIEERKNQIVKHTKQFFAETEAWIDSRLKEAA